MSLSLNLTFGGGSGQLEQATEAEITRLKGVYDSLDKDESGGLSEYELKQAMERLGQKTVSSGELKEMMLQADLDGNGVIDFEEFCAMYGKAVEGYKDEAGSELYDCFRVMDTDGNGYIERDELVSIMCGLGTKSFRAPTAEDVDDLIREADIDGDGRINYEEFVKIMINHHGAI